MRYLAILISLVLLSGCTSFQAKEARRSIAGGLFEMALDIATDGPERRQEERRRWEDNPANRWDACLPPCEITSDLQDRADALEREEDARRKREREVRHYEDEANWMLDALEETEQRSGQSLPESASTDHDKQDLEREQQREEALRNQAEFDEFMLALETAEGHNSDPRLNKITGER